MEYRKLSNGGEMISTLGLGMGGIHKTTPDEIEAVIRSHCTARCPFRVTSRPASIPSRNISNNFFRHTLR